MTMAVEGPADPFKKALRKAPVKRTGAPVDGLPTAPRKRAPAPKKATKAAAPKPRKAPAKKAAKAAPVASVSAPAAAPTTPALPRVRTASPPGPRARTAPARVRGGDPGLGFTVASSAGTLSQHRASHPNTGRPRVGQHALSGAIAGGGAGAGVGAALGGPPGAGVGAAAGGAAGAAGGALTGRRARRAYAAQQRQDKGTDGPRRLIVAEFLVCMLIASLAPLTDKRKDEPAGSYMKRMAALMGLFLVLALVSAFGRGPAKVAAGIGGLATVTLVVSDRDLFVQVASIFGKKNAEGGATDPANTNSGEASGPGPSLAQAEGPNGGLDNPMGDRGRSGVWS